MTRKPTLFHIPVSHYSEKVRWALAYKGIEHERRAPPPPANMLLTAAVSRGRAYTFPLLRIDGRWIPDSTEIIFELERRWPEPRLIPSDPRERKRALSLEEWFDDELGPELRLLAWHEVTADPERAGLAEVAGQALPERLRRAPGATRAMAAFASGFVALRYRVRSEKRAEIARVNVLAALDRLERELGEGDYLVGDSFSVADLTAAALFYPLVSPPEGPQQLTQVPAAFEAFRAPLRDRPGYRWVEQMFRRHRRDGPGSAG